MSDELNTQSKLHHVHAVKFSILLAVVLLLLVVNPIAPNRSGLVLRILLTALLLSGVYASMESARSFWIVLPIALPGLAANWFTGFASFSTLIWIGQICQTAFIGYIIYRILAYILRQREVTVDVIVGSVCAYLLLGIACGMVFNYIEILWPESYAFGDHFAVDAAQTPAAYHDRMSYFTYYSFITLTTLGYGDISPIRPLARSLAALESILGQFYIAVLVARLVGVQVSQSLLRSAALGIENNEMRGKRSTEP